MNADSEQNRNVLLTSVMKYFGIVMAITYVGGGISILLQSNRLFDIPRIYAVPIGIILIGYGVFRGYRLYLKYFQKESI